MIAARIAGGAQAAVGTVMLLAPERVAALAASGQARAPGPIVRVLGARIAGQGALIAVRPSDGTLTLGAVVDGLHLSSMLALAVAVPRLRRTALVSAAVAGLSIAAAGAARR